MQKVNRLSDEMNTTWSDYALLVLLAVIFGASFTMTSVSVAEIPPATLVAGRLLIAAVILFVAMKFAGQKLPPFDRVWIIIFCSALFGNALPFFLISWGQETVDAGLAAILMAIMPLATIIIAHFWTHDEKLNQYKLIGFFLGILGVVVLIGFDKLGSLGDDAIRQYAITAAAICYAINVIITKKLVGMPRRAMAAALVGVSALIMIPVSLFLDDPLRLTPSANALTSLVLLAIFPTAIGTLLIFAIIKRRGASFFSQINFMIPVAGVLWGIILLSESLPARAWVALSIILAGVALARIQPKSRLIHRATK